MCNAEMYMQEHFGTFTYRHVHIREDIRKNQVPIKGAEVCMEVHVEASMKVYEKGGKCV